MDKNTGTITIKRDALWKYATFILLAVLIIGAIIYLLPEKTSNGGNDSTTATVKVVESDNFAYGSVNSEVYIVEWSDFECPFCARAYAESIAQVKDAYSEEEVAIIYRDFPLTSIHPNAQKSAEASECAADQGKFREMHDMLFERGVAGGVDSFKSYAEEIGLDMTKFNSCLDSGEKAAEIRKDLSDGQAVGIQGTPGFVVASSSDGKGTIISGAQPFVAFQNAIERELNR